MNVWVIIEPHWNLKVVVEAFQLTNYVVIIEPHWNLKYGRMIFIALADGSNNRTTLESKVFHRNPSYYLHVRNNRTTLESKE